MALSLGLLAAYVLIAVLVLIALRQQGLPPSVKLGLAAITCLFYFVTWFGIEKLLGQPSPSPLPSEFRVIGFISMSPREITKGNLLLAALARQRGNAKWASAAYKRPYSIPEAIAAEAANQKLQDGELLNGRQSRAAISSSDKKDKDTSGNQATDGTPQDTAALYFEFFGWRRRPFLRKIFRYADDQSSMGTHFDCLLTRGT